MGWSKNGLVKATHPLKKTHATLRVASLSCSGRNRSHSVNLERLLQRVQQQVEFDVVEDARNQIFETNPLLPMTRVALSAYEGLCRSTGPGRGLLEIR